MIRIRCLPLAVLALAGLALLVLVLAAPAAVPAAAQGVLTPTWRFDFLRQWAPQPPPGIFNVPWGMAFDATGNLYVVDLYNHRVQVLDRQGNAIRAFGHLGDGPGEIYFPLRVAVDGQGTVYVTDVGNQRVVRFAPDGTPLPSWEGFQGLNGIGVGGNGSVYVTDNIGRWPASRGRLHKFSSDGSSHRIIAETSGGFGSLRVKREGGADVIHVLVPNRVLQDYNAEGALLGEAAISELTTIFPLDLEMDKNGALYLIDQDAHEVFVRSARGAAQRWGGFLGPQGLAVGPDGLMYVSDGQGGNFGTGRPTDMRIQRYTPQGELVLPTWGSEEGHAPGQLVNPDAITWSQTGHVWVHDNADGRFQQFTSDGSFVTETPRLAQFRSIVGMQVDRQGHLLVTALCRMYTLSPTGETLSVVSPADRTCPRGFDLDSADNRYVADVSNQRALKLDGQGQLLKVYGGPDQLDGPEDVALDEPRDRLYVLDEREVPIDGLINISTRIQVYRLSDGVLEDTWIVPSIDPRRPLADAWITHVDVDDEGYVYASDVTIQTIWKLEPVKGEPVAHVEPGGSGVGPGAFDVLSGWWKSFTLDPEGNLYTVEGVPNSRVQVFTQVGSSVTPTVTVTPMPTMTSSATATASPSATLNATATPTATTSVTPSATASATLTPTPPETTVTPTTTRTAVPTPTATGASELHARLYLPYLVGGR